jgi:hypothetical protein
MAEEKPRLQSVTVERHPAGGGYRLNAHMIVAGNFGRPFGLMRMLPERFQTVEAAEAFAAAILQLDSKQVRRGITTPS